MAEKESFGKDQRPLGDEKFNEKSGEYSLGHYTHEKNPAASAAGLAVINIIEDEGLTLNALEIGASALERLRALKGRYNFIGDMRGMGLLIGIWLVKDKTTKEPEKELAEKIMYRALELGLSFKVTMGNILTLPPLFEYQQI